MQGSWWIVAALSAVLVISGDTRAGQKPAALPNQQQIECPEFQETGKGTFSLKLGVGEKGITFEIDVRKAETSVAPMIDTVSPTLVPAYLEMLLRHVGAFLTPAPTKTDGGATIGQTDKAEAQARQFFNMAEFYRRTGHFSSARFCYQRVHSLQPTTQIGRLAIERLNEIEGRLREAEESEDPETVYRQIHERTIPLGLVEVTY